MLVMRVSEADVDTLLWEEEMSWVGKQLCHLACVTKPQAATRLKALEVFIDSYSQSFASRGKLLLAKKIPILVTTF